MRALVIVLCDTLDQLGRTSGSLDDQTLGAADHSASYLGAGLGAEETQRLAALARRRPHVRAVATEDRGASLQAELTETGATHVLVVENGAHLQPEALERLLAVADKGSDVVVGRQVGRPTWGAGSSGPVAAVLAAAPIVASLDVPAGAPSAHAWLQRWHDALLAAPGEPGVLEDYPTLAADLGASAPADLVIQRADGGWEAGTLVLDAVVSPGSSGLGEPTFVLWGLRGLEYLVETTVSAEDAGTRLTGRLDVRSGALGAPLPDGAWDVGIRAMGPGILQSSLVPRFELPAGIVEGRAVVSTLRTSHLKLQVGSVRRRFFRALPEAATITESATGTALALPLEGPHLADDEPLEGSLYLGGLRIPATITTTGGQAVLHAFLSGLAADYPMSVSFGHREPVSLGLTLAVDGAGAMRLVPRAAVSKPAAAPASAEAPTGRLARARRALPEPVVRGLKRVPGLSSWYAGRR